MNQTKKRLAIIKLAISLTDTETIQLQVLKLGMLRTDSRLREIMEMLEEKKYAQSQMLISAYIDSPTETTIIQRTPKDETKDSSIISQMQLDIEEPVQNSQELTEEESMIQKKEAPLPPQATDRPLTLKEKIQKAKDQAIIDQFQLFTETAKDPLEDVAQELDNYDDFLDTAPKPKKMSTVNVNYDALLNVDAKDVLPDNITLDIDEEVRNDDFLKIDDININTIILEEEQEDDEKNTENIAKEVKDEEASDEEKNLEAVKVDTQYKAIPYIEQKLQNMQTQYPALHEKKETFTSVSDFMSEISSQGYTESSIEKILAQIETLKSENKAEAAQLLLVAGGTESNYAQFSLARELFKGDVLQKNLPESFTLINRLATNENYPEALCDLAQFHENGIGTEQDTKRAQELYKEAMDLGIHRASEHYERMTKKGKGLLSIFKR